MLQFNVTDSGQGITPELQDKILLPFFTTKPIGKGTGLGLSISMGIAQAHQGQLLLNRFSNHTQFHLILPKRQTAKVALAA